MRRHLPAPDRRGRPHRPPRPRRAALRRDEVTAVLSEAEALIAAVRQTGTVRDFVHIRELLGGYLESIAGRRRRIVRSPSARHPHRLRGPRHSCWAASSAATSSSWPPARRSARRRSCSTSPATPPSPRAPRVAFFSIEMAAEQLVQRLLATESGVDSTRLTFGHHTEREQRKVMQALGVLSDLPVFFDDSACADDVRHARQGQAPAARARPRPDRRRLPAADEQRHAQREPRAGGERHLALAQAARPRPRRAGRRLLAALPCRREPRQQHPDAQRPPRVRQHRAGRRRRHVHLPRGPLHHARAMGEGQHRRQAPRGTPPGSPR